MIDRDTPLGPPDWEQKRRNAADKRRRRWEQVAMLALVGIVAGLAVGVLINIYALSVAP